MQTIYTSLLNEERSIIDQSEMRSSIQSLSTHWIDLTRQLDELTSTYEAQHRAWTSFEAEWSPFRDQVLVGLEQRFQSVASTDLTRSLDPHRTQTAISELKVRQRMRQ